MTASLAGSASGGAARRPRRGALTNISTYKVAVYNTLREEIKTLELQPGERLVEELLSDRFGISKTPIREALLLLESDHLIELIPHVGGAVTWMSLAEYEQELFLLDSLELPALELVAERATEEDMARWDAKVVDIRRLSRSEDRLEYRAHVSALHADIFTVSGYPRLVGIISSTQMLLFRYSVLFIDRDPSRKSREHELEIVTMRVRHLRNRDASAAAAVVRRRHAEQFKRAQERVAAGDPLVMPYLAEGQ
ncbi:MAG: GntR family transcriptional regulator [Acidimicrobiales bacterium]|jgi:DNA-binding GntR family transcriptional regulator